VFDVGWHGAAPFAVMSQLTMILESLWGGLIDCSFAYRRGAPSPADPFQA